MTGPADSEFMWNVISNLVEIIGILSALFIALFADRIKRIIFAPRLHIDIENERGELTYYSDNTKTKEEKEVRYFHLNISSEKSVSKRTTIYISKIEKVLGDRKTILWEGDIPLNWMHSETLGYMHREIVPNHFEKCDFIALNRDGMKITVSFYPNNFKFKWDEAIHIHVYVYGKNEENISSIFCFDVDWNGKYEGSERILECISIHKLDGKK